MRFPWPRRSRGPRKSFGMRYTLLNLLRSIGCAVLPLIWMATDKRRDSLEYWNARLTRMGLGHEAGSHRWLRYGHRVSELDCDGVKTYTAPEEIEDRNEWPISL